MNQQPRSRPWVLRHVAIMDVSPLRCHGACGHDGLSETRLPLPNNVLQHGPNGQITAPAINFPAPKPLLPERRMGGGWATVLPEIVRIGLWLRFVLITVCKRR